MEIPELTPDEVAERLRGDASAVYLDVRTEREFVQGHPEGALNVPVFHVDPSNGMPTPNERFLEVCEAHLERDAAIYVGCASGQRSLQAAALLRGRGWSNVVNVDAGFSGKQDPLGNVLRAGWMHHGLPSEAGDGGERSYRSLLAEARDGDTDGD